MKQIIEIPALVEATSSNDMVEASICLSTKSGQITLEIPEWESRIEIPAEHLTKALAALVPPAVPPVDTVSVGLVQHLGQKLSRCEQQIAAHSAAVAQQGLTLEAALETLEGLRGQLGHHATRLDNLANYQTVIEGRIAEESKRINGWATRIEDVEVKAEDALDRIAEHHNSLSFAERHIETLEKEQVLAGQIEASFQGQINTLGERIDVLENNLAEPPAETAAMALYGGEQ